MATGVVAIAYRPNDVESTNEAGGAIGVGGELVARLDATLRVVDALVDAPSLCGQPPSARVAQQREWARFAPIA